MKRLTSFTAAAALLLPLAVWAADLTVNVAGLHSTEGDVRVALYDAEETFLQVDARLAGARLKARSGAVRTLFTGLKSGTYAVSVYHDENSNAQLDKNFLGIPREGYGFSNGARAFFGPPGFSKAAFTVDEEHQVITITLRY